MSVNNAAYECLGSAELKAAEAAASQAYTVWHMERRVQAEHPFLELACSINTMVARAVAVVRKREASK